jgi:hypothetical protein
VRLVAVAIAALAAAGFAGGGTSQTLHVVKGDGLRALVPPGWHVTEQRLVECTDPTPVAAITNARGQLSKRLSRGTALILLLEDRGALASGFPRRTTFKFTSARSFLGGCCDMPTGVGEAFTFRDHGRNLYAFVYAATPRQRKQALAILNTLAVEPR